MSSNPEIPATMRAARCYTADDIRVEELPVPDPGPGEALVRGAACGICTGELMPWYMARKAPSTPGHEPSGRIVALGEGVQDWQVGDRVFVHHHAPCGQCPACKRGAYVHCPTWRSTKLPPGGMAEYYLVQAANLKGDTLRLPDNVSDAAATMIEPLACCVKAQRRGGVKPGSSVVVIGLGFMGLLNTALALHLGASVVIGSDLVAARCERAKRLGAQRVVQVGQDDLLAAVREETNGQGAEVVIVGPGSVAALQQGLACVAGEGALVQFAPIPDGATWQLDANDTYFREVSIIPAYSCGPNDTRIALDLIASGAFKAEDFIDKSYPLDQVATAFADMARGQEVTKAIVTF